MNGIVKMEITNSQIGTLITYYEKSVDYRALCVLDLLYTKKIIIPLQRAFFNRHGAPYSVYPLDGSGVRFRPRTD